MRSIRYVVSTTVAVGAVALVSLVVAWPASAAPTVKAPFPCGQRWTYDHHPGEVRRALDFIRADGGTTVGTPVLASAGGTATRHVQPSGAGNYISIDHGGGWKTYYFHLSAFSVASGARVGQGQQVGVTGSTGNSTGAHIHYEQLLNGTGQTIRINGRSLAPYPGSYGSRQLTSDNDCGGGGGTSFNTWGTDVLVRADARLSAPRVTTRSAAPTPYARGGTARPDGPGRQGSVGRAPATVRGWTSPPSSRPGRADNARRCATVG